MKLFHIALVVPDLDRTMRDLSRTLDLHWREPTERESGSPFPRTVFSVEGPPFYELLQGPSGGPWDGSDGPRFDHVGYWSDDLEADKRRLAHQGVEVEVDGATLMGTPFGYFRDPANGLRFELVDVSVRRELYQRWGRAEPEESSSRPSSSRPNSWPLGDASVDCETE
jgi:catechol 2,3-dioxygenase-like lactoylglutathione lyase family enzyme